jgi:GNAT superfamily N-acetyltransferase
MSTTDDSQSCIEAIFERDRDDEITITVKIIVIAREDRGKGLARKLVEALLSCFEGRIYRIIVFDMSGGFWEKMKSTHPEIDWVLEDC